MKIGIKKSGIIIIGNEILNGKTIEKNSNFLCKKLSDRGIEVTDQFDCWETKHVST